ncbi:mitogen-activated protein kinase kinase kinase 7-like isoform X4 [Panulirus ornatus]|uniref:mitogen-activated protein kinase kinase kinase 7-like isoform X4 n=1 Tax=Panulirus ornatus TaxID=150431 RepID=UPI003A8BFEB2
MHISAMDYQIENCQEIDPDEVNLLESIGKGSFGVVYKALWRGLTVAVKKVETESEVNAFYNEVQQLARVQHDNIIYLHGACVSDIHKCLVIEYADGGSLYHLLHNSPNTQYNLAHGISWLLQCAKAVSYLHAIQPRPLLHRDLKPPNLLLTKGAKILKVCDFGTACELSTIMSDNRGSAAWMAPEVFEGKLYTEKCDVYSWGIILWEVMTRRVPFQDLGLAVRIMWAVHQRQRPPLVTGCPKLLENLMKRCWDHNQVRRPRMEEVVEKISVVTRFLKGADEPINNPPSDDAMRDTYRSPRIGSSAGHTSQDVSEISYSGSCSDPCARRKIQSNDIGHSTLHNEDASMWITSGSEGTYPIRDTGDSSSPRVLPPAISPNVSSTVVVTGDTGSPWSTAPSDDMEDHKNPLAIIIPNAEPPSRSDITLVPPRAPVISLPHSCNVTTTTSSVGGVSPTAVPMRQHLTPSDPNAHFRRRSAEVTPQPTSYREGTNHGGGCHNGEGGGGGGGGGGTEGGGGPDEEELGAFWEILENDIRPIKPLPSCPESQKIFSEHKEMARKYLVLQQEIFNLRKHKSILENKLSQAEKLEQLGNQRYQDKIRELESKRENLYHNQSRLKQQLEQICTRQEEQQKRQLQQDDGNDVGLDHLPLAPP